MGKPQLSSYIGIYLSMFGLRLSEFALQRIIGIRNTTSVLRSVWTDRTYLRSAVVTVEKVKGVKAHSTS